MLATKQTASAVILIGYLVILLAIYLFSRKMNTALQSQNLAQFQEDEKIVQGLSIAAFALALVSIGAFLFGKSSTVIIPL